MSRLILLLMLIAILLGLALAGCESVPPCQTVQSAMQLSETTFALLDPAGDVVAVAPMTETIAALQAGKWCRATR